MSRESDIQCFGGCVLQILEEDKDWGGDTFEEIKNVARQLGLCEDDEHGFFRRTEKAKGDS